MKLRRILSVFLFAVCFFLLSIAEKNPLPALMLVQTFIHEAGHLTAALFSGAKIRGMGIQNFGLTIDCDTSALSYKKELIITVSGAASNLLVSAPLYFLPAPSVYAEFFRDSGLALAVFNLLPFSKTDGGRILEILSEILSHDGMPSTLPKNVGAVTAFLFWLLCVASQFRYRENISLLILSDYILINSLLCLPK